MTSFPFLLQRNQMDCGPTCLYMVSKYYGRSFSVEKLRELSEIGKAGVNIICGNNSVIYAVHGINSCLWINQFNDVVCNCRITNF